MVRIIKDTYSETKPNTHREMTFEFDHTNPDDVAIIEKIGQLCKRQPSCENCVNFQLEGSLGGYDACSCRIYGNIESFDHPHHDMDGSKCADYLRKYN